VAKYLIPMGSILLGLASLALWIGSRRSERIWRRNVGAFGAATSPAFARGFAGGSILGAVGLIVLGLLPFVLWHAQGLPPSASGARHAARVVIAASLLVAFVSFVSMFIVAWLGRPRFLFPIHARALPPPWREARQGRSPGNSP
jgi:hypothetical protein